MQTADAGHNMVINFFLFIPLEIEMCLASNPNINSVLETWIIIIFLVK